MNRLSCCLLIVLTCLIVNPISSAEPEFSKYVDEQGSISFPKEYLSQFQHIGSIALPEDSGVSEIHHVYAKAKDVRSYRKQGKYPDGAVLVKDIYSSKTVDVNGSPTAIVDELLTRFVMIKDRKNRFPENKIWANGWGWSQFDSDNLEKNVATDFENDCKSCHLPVKKTDWSFTSLYHALNN